MGGERSDTRAVRIPWPQSLQEAIGLPVQHGQDARVVAGGHSLIPMVKLRLAKPEQLVGLQDLSELRGIRNEGGTLVIGAIAAHLLEVYDDNLEWDVDRFRVKGVPELSKTMTELACAAYNNFRRAWSRGSKRSAIMTRRT